MPGNDSYTKLLLHFNESNSAFRDSSLGGNRGLASNSGVVYDAGGKFNGAGYYDGSGCLQFGSASYWNLTGSDLWTIDFWVNFLNTPSGVNVMMGIGDTSIYVYPEGGQFSIFSSGFPCYTEAITFTQGWQHLAVTHTPTSYYMFYNGDLKTLTSNSYTVGMGDQTSPLYVGCRNGTDHLANVMLDEFRISKGIARWTSSFTPPDKQYSLQMKYAFPTYGVE